MEGALRIQRLRAHCAAATAGEAVAELDDRVARGLRHHLPDTLRRAFGSELDAGDDIWIVRHMDLSLDIAADAAPDAIARLFSERLRHLLASLMGGGASSDILHFSSRAAHVTHFILDLVSGQSVDRWYYARFAGLKTLSRSSAIRTLLTEDPREGAALLSALDDRALASVVRILTAVDERCVLEAFATKSPSTFDEQETVEQPDARFARAWRGYVRAVQARVERGEALFAFVRSIEAAPTRATLDAVLAIVGAATDAKALYSRGTRPRPDRESHISDRATSLGEDLPTPRVAPTSDESTTLPDWIVEAIRSRATRPGDHVDRADADSPLATRFGGTLLLLRDLDGLPWSQWTEDWPELNGVNRAIAARWLTAMLTVGPERTQAAAEDAALRLLFGVPPGIGLPDVASWINHVGEGRRRRLAVALAGLNDASTLTPAHRRWLSGRRDTGLSVSWRDVFAQAAHLVLRRFARRLPGFAESTPHYLWHNVLAFEATVDLEPDRVVVYCGRPPLHLMLTLTGMTRGLLAGHDPGGRPILLFSSD